MKIGTSKFNVDVCYKVLGGSFGLQSAIITTQLINIGAVEMTVMSINNFWSTCCISCM